MKLYILLAILAILFAACWSDDKRSPTDPTRIDISWNESVTEITLSDGTRCAVLDGDGGSGITCDWRER